MFRVGIVKARDTAAGRLRVVFPDRDQMQSWWLPMIQRGTQNEKDFWLPDVGEQVVCLMDEHHEDGAVLGAIYSSADTPPTGMTADKRHLTAHDGAVFEYDRAAHAFKANLPAGATITIAAGGAAISIDPSGNINIDATADIKLVTNSHADSWNSVVSIYNSHTHPDPQGGNTGVPSQQIP